MTNLTWLLVLIGVVVFAVVLMRTVSRMVGQRLWRLTLIVLAIAILAATGLFDTQPILNEIGYAVTNLFGTPNEGSNP